MRGRFDLICRLVRQGFDPNQALVMLALREALLGCPSVLDVGCGVSKTMRLLGVEHAVGAEAYPPSLKQARAEKTHADYVECDVRQLGEHFPARQYDACIALDVIEHLDKPGGLKLIADMERIARRRVIFLTPCGFLPQGQAIAGDLQAHHSGWEPEEMERMGYRVIGLLGPKSLRGEYHRLKHRPAIFWGVISLVMQILWSRRHPKSAAAILCIKDLPGKP